LVSKKNRNGIEIKIFVFKQDRYELEGFMVESVAASFEVVVALMTFIYMGRLLFSGDGAESTRTNLMRITGLAVAKQSLLNQHIVRRCR